MTVKFKTLLLLFLVVVLPTALLSWGGYQIAQQQSNDFEIQVKSLLKDQLTELDTRIEKYFSLQEASLQNTSITGFTDYDSVRDFVDSVGIVENVFIITANDFLAYPNPLISPLTQREEEFYAKIKTIVEDGDIQNEVLQFLAANNRNYVGNAGQNFQLSNNPSGQEIAQPATDSQTEFGNPSITNSLPRNGTPNNEPFDPRKSESQQPDSNRTDSEQQNTNRRQRPTQSRSNNPQSGNSIPNAAQSNDLSRAQNALDLAQQANPFPPTSYVQTLQTTQQSLLDRIRSIKEGIPESYETCSGWFVWYWGRGVNLIYWQRLATGNIVCVALERSRWMSDLIAELPDSVSSDSVDKAASTSVSPQRPSTLRTTKIVNASGESVYLWGNQVSDEMVLAAEIPVSHPLASWSLQMWVMPNELQSQSMVGVNIVLGIVASSIALIAVAWIFFREYTKEIQEASKRVSFVNQVSHELRTPLTNIRMYAELLGKDIQSLEGTDVDKAKQRIEVVESESERLSRLIGNVLTFAGSQKNKLEVYPTCGVIDDCVTQSLSSFAPNLEKLGIEIRTQLDAKKPVKFDADALGQIIGNLISNVEKYAPDSDFVEIETRQAANFSEIGIRDNGQGIDAKYGEKIFEPFWRLSNELQHASGTGIGLSISRELAKIHGGDLRLEDSDTGARFLIRIKTENAE